MQGFKEFEFDLPSALLRDIVQLLDGMPSGVLNSSNTQQIPEVQGVYQLFCNGQLVYIGKTDAEAGLRTRLTRHSRKILHRPTLLGSAVTFRAARILVFTAMDLETQLINHYRKTTGAVAWNGSGFGSNDPGRQREETDKAPEGFDATHPIDIDVPGEYVPLGTTTVATVLTRLKSILPYTLRYETLRGTNGRALRGNPHPDLTTTEVTVEESPQTVRRLMQHIVAALGSNWQATAFPSHVILYREQKPYTHGVVL
ncbi:GIY-YIG nuclease family protein [Paraburkholderia xenovorans]|nr:GIY-YIG nuclease family protein [Paraburkholderia xenovorans]